MSILTQKTSLLGVLMCIGYLGYGQNLVPNPSFETYSACPTYFGGAGPTLAPPWIAPTFGSPDLYNACSFGVVGVPFNWAGSQYSNSGQGHAGVYVQHVNEYREYIQAPLLAPLQANTLYSVSFFVNMADIACAAEWIGAYISVDAPLALSSSAYLDLEPQVESNIGYITETNAWVLISDCFTANGGERFITIGNFRSNAETPILPPCATPFAYYFIDDVIVEETTLQENIPLELGGPEVACLQYEIDPGYDGYLYTWSDGSHGPTLLVEETGVYSLTVSNECYYGVDSIQIYIHGNEPVDIGPDEVTICDGDAYVISLDPAFNEYQWNDGSTDPEYTITTAGTYTVTLDDGCETSADEITVDVVDGIPDFDLGEDMYLCFDEEIEISLDENLGQFLWQDNNTSTDYIITQPGTYILSITNVCGTQVDEINIYPLDPPELDIGPGTQILCTGASLVVNIDPGPGEISWQDGSDASSYVIDSAGTYSVLLTNLCGTAFDQVQVIQADTPYIDFGLDTILCNSEELTLSAVVAGGQYQWQDSSTSTSYLVNMPGTYFLTINNVCGTASDTIAVSYQNDLIPIDFGPDITLCTGEQIILHAGNQNANYFWQDSSQQDSLVVNSSGTYSLQLSNHCSEISDTITVLVTDQPPQVVLPDLLPLCQGDSLVLDALISGVNYLWSDNTINQQLTVNAPGTYSVTVSNTCGTDRDTITILDGGPAPAVSLGTDIDICPSQTITLSPVFSNVDTWLWQDGSVLPSYTVSTAGVITVGVGNACSTAYDTLNVNPLPGTPPLYLGADTSLCSGQSFSLAITTPNVNILWPDGSMGTAYTVSGPGQVYASVSNSCGVSSDTIEVLALPNIPDLNLGVDQSLCPGELITLSPGIPDVQYSWQDGSTSNSFQTTQQATVILTISNICGTSTDTLEIIESTQGPQVNLGTDIQVCAGEVVTIPSGISGVNYVWQDGSTNPSYTTTQSGVFILEVSNNCGSDSDTIAVDISGVAPTVDLGTDTTLCEGITLILESDADAITTIQWQGGSSTSSFAVTSPGIYSLAESNRCGDDQDTITVSYLDAPDLFTLGSDTTLCPGESLMLTAPSIAYDIHWQDGSDGSTFIADQDGTYSLQLSNDCGVVSDNLVLNYATRIPQLNADTSIPWCTGDIFSLDATQPFAATYSWSNGAVTPSITITSPGLYSIDVSTPCSTASQIFDVIPGTDCEVIEVHQEIFIPNVFSPNGDGVNDLFSVSFGSDVEVTAMQGSIFDRWGNLGFSSSVIPFIWNGYFEDEEVMPGVYVYLIKVTYMIDGKEHERVFTGDVTVLR